MKLRKINDMYSTDGEFIYRYGMKQPEIDTKTFRLIGREDEECTLGLDKNFVYKYDGIIEGADPNSFEYIEKCFFRDEGSVYCSYHRLDDLDPGTMRVLSGLYVGDEKNLYYCDWQNVKPPFLVVPKPDMQQVQVHGEWAFDDQNMYFAGEPVAGVDCGSIVFFDEYGFFKDKNAVFYQGSRLEGADPRTFRPLGNGYGKDETNVYFFSEKIVGADAGTFMPKGKMWGWGVDADRTYHYGKSHEAREAD
jgi:hypothetical protein